MLDAHHPQGQQHEIKATQDVDLDKIKMGQRLNVTFYDEVALAIGRRPVKRCRRSRRAKCSVVVSPPSRRRSRRRSSPVDTTNNSVVVQGPQGEKHTLMVKDSEVQAQLGKIKAGDSMQVTYTQALAVSAEPSK